MFVLSSHLLPCKPMNIENSEIISILTNNFGSKSMDYIYQPRLIYKFYIKQQETLRFFYFGSFIALKPGIRFRLLNC